MVRGGRGSGGGHRVGFLGCLDRGRVVLPGVVGPWAERRVALTGENIDRASLQALATVIGGGAGRS